jgi:hypothetical protein
MVWSLLIQGFLHHFAEYYPAFHNVSDAITGLAFIVEWIGLAEREIQEFWMRSFLELQLPEIVEARNENDGYCHDDIWAIRQDWEEIESKLEINTGQ